MSDVITGPGWYRTRGGKRAEIIAKGRGRYWVGYLEGTSDHQATTWNSSGSYMLRGQSDVDLISRWTDPEETACVAVFRCGDNLLTKVIDADDSETTGEVGRAIVKLKGGA